MQENKHWEDSFQVYERGVALFKYPHVKDIWNAYLAQFVKRYGGTKLERARDLFRHALEMVRHIITCHCPHRRNVSGGPRLSAYRQGV